MCTPVYVIIFHNFVLYWLLLYVSLQKTKGCRCHRWQTASQKKGLNSVVGVLAHWLREKETDGKNEREKESVHTKILALEMLFE